MARKKKTTKKGNGLFSFFSKKKKTTRSSKSKAKAPISAGLKVTLGIVIATLLVAGAAVGFIYLDRYVKTTRPADKTTGPLAFYYPDWVNQQWKESIYHMVGNGPFPLDDTSARKIAERLETLSWLSNVRAQVKSEFIEIQADYRRPVGLVNLGRSQYYLDPVMTVMDYVPVTAVPVIEITGIASPRSIPSPGSRWAAEDAAAAVQILDVLYKMDLHFQQQEQLEKPLLDEVKNIDVSNFAARKSNSQPHITLTIEDGTKIFWGAAWGQAGRYFEQEEKEKLTELYQFYMDHNNTLQGTAKYIELRQL